MTLHSDTPAAETEGPTSASAEATTTEMPLAPVARTRVTRLTHQQQQQQQQQQNQLQAMTTPPNRRSTLSMSSSLKRVHFSPHNEEFHTDMTPQSSPTKAQQRPLSRSILKRTAAPASVDNQQQMRSCADSDGLSSLALDSDMLGQDLAAQMLFGGASAFPQVAANSEERLMMEFDVRFATVVDRLKSIELDTEQAMALVARIYNELCGTVARFSGKFAEPQTSEPAVALLECLLRDITNPAVLRPVVLAAIKCTGCMLHIDKVCTTASPKLIGDLILAVQRRVKAQFDADKAVCQAAIWCISMLRAPASCLRPIVSDLVALCANTLSKFETSTSAQFECLSAIETLLRRSPSATREVYHVWLFPVFLTIMSPIPGIRAKADNIVRHNIPWVAADVQRAEVDEHVLAFVSQHLGRILASADRLLGQGEHLLVARVWGMLIAICAKHILQNISGLLQIIQQCFNAKDPNVLVASLMQWRCLVYAFYVQRQLHHRKIVKLVLRPIVTILGQPDITESVRLACVRCWATLVYALGEHNGSLISAVLEVPMLVSNDTNRRVREIVGRVLAGLLNRFILPEGKVPAFVLPQMIIGTTNLAADGDKSLSNTHGPFSSESVYTGDHTGILMRYMVGLDTASPTVPVLVDAAIKFVASYFAIERGDCDLENASEFAAFGALCAAVAAALAQAGSPADGSLRPETLALADLYFEYSCFDDITQQTCSQPRALLLQALCAYLRPGLDAHVVTGNALLQECFVAPSFGKAILSPASVTDNGLQQVPPVSYGFAMTLVALADDAYRLAKASASGKSDEMISEIITNEVEASMAKSLDQLLPVNPPGGSSRSHYDSVIAIVVYLSRLQRGIHWEDSVGSSSIRALLVITMRRIAARTAYVRLEDSKTVRLLVWELLGICCSIPPEARAIVAGIMCRCCATAAAAAEGQGRWAYTYTIVAALIQDRRLRPVNGGNLGPLAALLSDLPVTLSNEVEVDHCVELILLLINGAIPWQFHGLHSSVLDSSSITNASAGNDKGRRAIKCVAKCLVVLNIVLGGLSALDREQADGMRVLVRALVWVVHVVASNDIALLCRPFADDLRLPWDANGGDSHARKGACVWASGNLVRIRSAALQVLGSADSKDSMDPKKFPMVVAAAAKRSLDTMLCGDDAESEPGSEAIDVSLAAGECCALPSKPAEKTNPKPTPAAKVFTRSQAVATVSVASIADKHEKTADPVSAAETPMADVDPEEGAAAAAVLSPISELGSGAAEAPQDGAEQEDAHPVAAVAPRRKKKRRNKRKWTAVTCSSGASVNSSSSNSSRMSPEPAHNSAAAGPLKQDPLAKLPELLRPFEERRSATEEEPDDELAIPSSPSSCSLMTLDSLLDKIEGFVANDLRAHSVSDLVAAQARVAGIQQRLCKAMLLKLE